MVYKTVLGHKSYDLLLQIQSISAFERFYLAGGTALALQLGHRKSVDLDFFSNQNFTTQILQYFPSEYQALSMFDNSIELIASNTKVMFWFFGFGHKYPLMIEKGIKMASTRDIGLMKLLAIQGRSTRKDIVDLYFIDSEVVDLSELLKEFDEYYPKDKINTYSSIKALFDEDFLKKDAMPVLLKKAPDFDTMFQTVKSKIVKYMSKHILNISKSK